MCDVKSFTACQANNICKYKDTKREILNCNANIFNQQYLKKGFIPEHPNIGISRQPPAAKHTKTKIHLIQQCLLISINIIISILCI